VVAEMNLVFRIRHAMGSPEVGADVSDTERDFDAAAGCCHTEVLQHSDLGSKGRVGKRVIDHWACAVRGAGLAWDLKHQYPARGQNPDKLLDVFSAEHGLHMLEDNTGIDDIQRVRGKQFKVGPVVEMVDTAGSVSVVLAG